MYTMGNAYADTGEDIKNYITGGLSDIFKRLTGGIDYSQNNPLNTNEPEAMDLHKTGTDVISIIIDLFIAMKDFAISGINFLSPVELNTVLVLVIAITITGVFLLKLLKRIGWHIFVSILIGLGIVAVYVFWKINS